MLKRCVAAAVLLTFVGGCAQPSSTGAPASAAPGSTALPVSAPPTPRPDISDLTVPAKPAGKVQTISGTVTAGVEPRCLLLQDTQGLYQLLFHDPALRSKAPVGATVTLTGTANPGQMSTCQQGVPFVVTSVG